MTSRQSDPEMPHPVTPYPKLIINAALTGMIPTKATTPHVPVSPQEIVRDAAACFAAGAAILHLHARDAEGAPTHEKSVFAEIITGVREACPGAIVCATTSGRSSNTFETRSQVLELDGGARPDMASLTLGSLNFPNQASINEPDMIEALAVAMKRHGIVPELEVFEAGMIHTAKVLIRRGILEPPFYFNLLLGSLYTAPGTLHDLASMVRSLPGGATWAGAGIGCYQLKMNLAAMLMGGHVRVGLEDNLYFDHAKTELAGNRRLIERVTELARIIDREVATAEEARVMIGLAPAGDAAS